METAHWVLQRSFLLLCLLYVSVSAAAAWDLVLLHTNDVHARVEETSRESGKCTKGSCFAGVSRRATKIKEIRSREKNVLLLDAGDQFQGTVWFNVYKGLEAAHFMNKLGYDAMALGNHEFDNGVEGLKPFLRKVNCTVLSANIRPDDTLASQVEGLYLPYTIFHVNGERVGVVGYTSKETPALSQPGPHMQFEDEVSSMQPHVDKLLTLGVNKIIALGHSGFIVDRYIAKKLRGVDVVIGGHTNTFLYTGSPNPSSEIPAGPYPFMVRSDYGGDVPVVQAYAFGKYLGYLRVSFDAAGNVLRSTGNPILLDSTVAEDPAMRAEVDEWKRSLANYSAKYVGTTLVYLNGTAEECRHRECNLGNLICDAMIDNNIKYADELQWNHVSSCIYNSGGIRTAIDERARNGTITMEDLIAVMPFGGTFDLVELRGSTLWKVFEHSVGRYGQGAGEFLQVSGFHVEYDVSMTPGHRVKSLQILCTSCRVPHYEPVEQEQVYKVVLPSYLVTGGDGYAMIKQEKLKHNSGDLDISVLSNFIAERKKIHPSVEGRIRISSSASGLSPTTTSVILTALLYTLYGSL